MRTTRLETGGSINYSLGDLSLNVVNISEADLDATGTNSGVQMVAPQVRKL